MPFTLKVQLFTALNTSLCEQLIWGLFHKTSLPNKPGLFQLVWLFVSWFGSK